MEVAAADKEVQSSAMPRSLLYTRTATESFSKHGDLESSQNAPTSQRLAGAGVGVEVGIRGLGLVVGKGVSCELI